MRRIAVGAVLALLAVSAARAQVSPPSGAVTIGAPVNGTCTSWGGAGAGGILGIVLIVALVLWLAGGRGYF